MQGEENGATTEAKKTLWVMLEDPQHVLRKDVDWVCAPRMGGFEPVEQFKGKTTGEIQEDWSSVLLFRCRLEDHPDYQTPKVEPLRWVEKTKPDKPGIWARIDYGLIEVACCFASNTEWNDWDLATRCYLGPIPEILPPRKKVVQRLWILHSKQTATDAAEYLQSWIPEEHEGTLFGNWIRTDETREVEQ